MILRVAEWPVGSMAGSLPLAMRDWWWRHCRSRPRRWAPSNLFRRSPPGRSLRRPVARSVERREPRKRGTARGASEESPPEPPLPVVAPAGHRLSVEIPQVW